ncbi:MAG TPA: hypothetical protein V6D15_11765 [Oculatellaceae cyanobacterium]|jgi:HD-GYP domain-containing protein (c-di-GMP phosphodiesterase class II)
MSFDHKAFVFDYNSFERELKSIIEDAIDTGSYEDLERYIIANLNFLKDPHEGESLSEDWKEMLEYQENPDQYGDFAMTKFYNPAEDVGLGHEWADAQSILSNEFEDSSIVLGTPIERNAVFFDPGKMGSYFQSSNMVIENKQKIDILIKQKPEYAKILEPVTYMFECAIAVNKGLYITF